MKTKNNNKESNCIINPNKIEEISCEIEESDICNEEYDSEIDIEIGDNDPKIDYSKYPDIKNFYISGLKKLYTSTIIGGLLNYGECSSDLKN